MFACASLPLLYPTYHIKNTKSQISVIYQKEKLHASSNRYMHNLFYSGITCKGQFTTQLSLHACWQRGSCAVRPCAAWHSLATVCCWGVILTIGTQNSRMRPAEPRMCKHSILLVWEHKDEKKHGSFRGNNWFILLNMLGIVGVPFQRVLAHLRVLTVALSQGLSQSRRDTLW